MNFKYEVNPIFLFTSPIKINQNHEGLAGMIRKHFGDNFLISGAAFIFVGRSRRNCKILYYDGTGFVMIYKKFVIQVFPHVDYLDEIKEITYQDFELLFSGRLHKISL